MAWIAKQKQDPNDHGKFKESKGIPSNATLIFHDPLLKPKALPCVALGGG